LTHDERWMQRHKIVKKDFAFALKSLPVLRLAAKRELRHFRLMPQDDLGLPLQAVQK
jgi:hypothetical protein